MFFLQMNIDFRAVCIRYGYGDCSNKLFEMWPTLVAKVKDLKLPAKLKGLLFTHQNEMTRVKDIGFRNVELMSQMRCGRERCCFWGMNITYSFFSVYLTLFLHACDHYLCTQLAWCFFRSWRCR